MGFLRTLIFTTLLMGLFATATHGQEIRYVSDVLHVPLRSGQGNEFRIINAGLRSGTALQLLEEDDAQSWARVRTPNGIEGWVRMQYLITARPAQLQLSEALASLAKLEKSNKQLEQQNQQLSNESTSLRTNLGKESSSRKSLAGELQKIKLLSANAIKMEQEYEELSKKHQLIQTERDALVAENELLKGDQRMDYMLYGAGILILGIIIALVAPSLIPKKGYSEWAS